MIVRGAKIAFQIGDFGMARDVSDDNYYVTKGGKLPLRWCAPEVIFIPDHSITQSLSNYHEATYL